MLETGKRARLRALPAVDVVLRGRAGEALVGRYGRAAAAAAIREALARLRQEISAGQEPVTSDEAVVAAASRILSGTRPRRVINATGVGAHTNLGRSVLSQAATEAIVETARGYSNLEYDLASGSRGSRYDHAVPLLRALTGTEDALVVNNCAGATLLALSAVAALGPGAAAGPVPRGQ